MQILTRFVHHRVDGLEDSVKLKYKQFGVHHRVDGLEAPP